VLEEQCELPDTVQSLQLEEDLSPHLRWSMGIRSILHAGKSKFQAYELVDSYSFGKVRPCIVACSRVQADSQILASAWPTPYTGVAAR
jgi:Spermidine synthase tetramerisation domain